MLILSAKLSLRMFMNIFWQLKGEGQWEKNLNKP